MPRLENVFTVGRTDVLRFQDGSALAFRSGMAVDADGAPRAYHPGGPNAGALDYTANAGATGNWYGVVTDTGRRDGQPVIQGPDDPAPGFYVSPTSLQDPSKLRTDPARYVDASIVPFIVLAPEVVHQGDVKLGDLAFVVNLRRRLASAAIFADVGPRGKLGEGSCALATAVGLNSSARHGGTDGGIAYVLFPASGTGWPRDLDELARAAGERFDALGGVDAVLQAFPL